MSMQPAQLATIIRATLATLMVLLLISASVWIMLPFMAALVWGAIIAISMYPAYLRLVSWLKGWRILSACIVGLGLTVILFLPLTVMILTLSDHLSELMTAFSGKAEMVPPKPPAWLTGIPLIGERLDLAWSKATADVAGTFEALRPRIREFLLWLLSRMAASVLMLLEAAFAIILASVFLVNAGRVKGFFVALIGRLGAADSEKIVLTTEKTTRSVSKGILGTAFIQAVLAWGGFALVGAPGPILLAFISFVLCSLQLGIMVIGIPVAIWLWSGDQWEWSIAIILWSVFVSVIDGALKPILLGQDFPVPIWVLFMGLIGGMLSMGLVGLFIGPIIISVSYQLMLQWVAADSTANEKQ